jgi:hypothetical protein
MAASAIVAIVLLMLISDLFWGWPMSLIETDGAALETERAGEKKVALINTSSMLTTIVGQAAEASHWISVHDFESSCGLSRDLAGDELAAIDIHHHIARRQNAPLLESGAERQENGLALVLGPALVVGSIQHAIFC